MTTTPKQNRGNFFEDFSVGQQLVHATPRTVTEADAALYIALYGSRFAVQSAETFATALGHRTRPLDDLLVFHIVFGKTVPDISLNAVANLGYAECRFLVPVYAGDTLAVTSEVIGLKQNSNGKTGVVYVRTSGENQHGEAVLSYVRWVMVRKRDAEAAAPEPVVPELASEVSPAAAASLLAGLSADAWDDARAGSPHRLGDYAVGERIDHVDGATIEEAEHQLATRLYQNTAKVHFNQHTEGAGRFGRRLVYGGHIISMARALTFNGLANAAYVLAINAGRHAAPCFAGDTIYAWSEILAVDARADTSQANASGFGALRVRTCAVKNRDASDYPGADAGATLPEDVVLDLDYWVAIPR
ncbi:MAG: MaoC family dehydratase [Pseudomonadota bacterium]